MESIRCRPLVPKLVSDDSKAAELRDLANRLIEHIEEHAPAIRCSDAYPMAPVTGLVRCRSFLRSMLNHDREGLHDLMGADLRLLFETSVYSLYAMHGDDQTRERLLRHDLRQQDVIARCAEWELDAVRETTTRRKDYISFKEMCRLADEALNKHKDESSDFIKTAYETLYRGESYLNVHPSLQSLGHYAYEDEQGYAVSLIRESDIPLASSRIMMATVLVGLLAREVFERVGLDAKELDRIADELKTLRALVHEPATDN